MSIHYSASYTTFQCQFTHRQLPYVFPTRAVGRADVLYHGSGWDHGAGDSYRMIAVAWD